MSRSGNVSHKHVPALMLTLSPCACNPYLFRILQLLAHPKIPPTTRFDRVGQQIMFEQETIRPRKAVLKIVGCFFQLYG